TFAFTGLPPSLEEMNQFLADESPQAREQVVDRLLQSPAYGEHIAKDWLDAARYADSYGRHEDGDMVTWPWRDWVIKSFNDNLPFDQFIIQQSAGDLLPNPTRDHLVATAFNRLALQSNESGNDPEEFRLDQVSDRVRANGLAFMGLSIECAKCHDHKYDPISQKEYWQMAAFFDNIDENGVYSQFCPQTIPSPSLLMPTAEQQSKLNDLQKQITAKDQAVQKIKNDARADFARWVASNNVPGALRNGAWNTVKSWFGGGDVNPLAYRAEGHFDFDITPQKPGDHRSLTNAADSKRPAKLRIKLETIKGAVKDGALMNGDDEVTFSKMGEYHQYDSFSFALWLQPREKRNRAVILSWSRGGNDDGRGYEVIMQEEIPSFALMHFQPGNEIRIKARKPLPLNEWTHLAVTYDGSSRAEGLKMFINGAPAEVDVVHDNLQLDIVRRKEWGDIDLDQIRFNLGGREHDSPLKNCGVDELWVFDRDISTGEVKYLAGKETKPDDWFDYWIQKEHKPWLIASAELKRLREMHTGVMNDVLEMMIMQELSVPRKWHVHPRGDFRQLAEEVQPDVPKNVLPFSSELPRNRLGFARWLVSRENPLTARVVVNRTWATFFGRGIVKTQEDFGFQSSPPSHPQLLDWLAVRFMEDGWSSKKLHRLIVTSQTYKQSSKSTAEGEEKDAENKFLWRGPRLRLDAEAVRDAALRAARLLSDKMFGPSVYP
ncbi:MAG: DUF1549 domain-containing protein, partial [Verrucomicrobiaceae bacterium]